MSQRQAIDRSAQVSVAKSELKRPLNGGTLSYDEIVLRILIVTFALATPFEFSKGGWRNPDYWTDFGDSEADYSLRADVDASDAIKDIWITLGCATGCKKACELTIMRAVVGLCEMIDRKNGNVGKNVAAFNKRMKGKEPSNVVGQFVHRMDGAVDIGDLVPGDQPWMRNPYYFALAEDRRRAYPGEGGTNVVYIGGGMFINPCEPQLLDFQGLREHIRTEFDSVPRSAGLDEFQFRRNCRPIVPSFIGERKLDKSA